MAETRLIEMERWPRAAHYRHFSEYPCAVSLTDEIDVTDLRLACRAEGVSFTAAILWCVAATVNAHEEFRLTELDSPEWDAPRPGVWDVVHPVFNVFHPETETYTAAYTLYDADFPRFAERMKEDAARAERLDGMGVPTPPNVFETSAVPWRHFTAVGAETGVPSLAPMVVWGGFRETESRVLLPLSIAVSHAAADGFHLARFLNETEERGRTLGREIGGKR
ncbi:MAG: chloramphenicol acetyltransferase CAT [Clostridia bacterium]|nr:chloramphenicol acetyltransferase CAT [Clostridia bacterium]